ncbi:MAG: CAP domain-containing protein [Alphaproteobacteria bacterium]
MGSSQVGGTRVESKAVATPSPAAATQSPGDVAPASPADAVRAVNAYRASKRRGPVVQNPALNATARAYAAKLARAGKVTHTLNGSTLVKRLAATGYEWGIAAENLGGGYRSLDQAMVGWKTSRKGHNEILLRHAVTELGFAMKTRANGRYRSYWVLVLASPGEPGGPQAFVLVPH